MAERGGPQAAWASGGRDAKADLTALLLKRVSAAGRPLEAERDHRLAGSGSLEQAFQKPGVKTADHWRSPADLSEQAVAALDSLAASIDFVLAAHLDERLDGCEHGPRPIVRQPGAKSTAGLAHRRCAGLALALKGSRESLGKHVVTPHRVADLDRPRGKSVDLGRLARQTAPAFGLQVAEGDQSLKVFESHRTVDTGHLRHLVNAPRLSVRVEAQQDVAAGEVAEGAEGTLHVLSHLPSRDDSGLFVIYRVCRA